MQEIEIIIEIRIPYEFCISPSIKSSIIKAKLTPLKAASLEIAYVVKEIKAAFEE